MEAILLVGLLLIGGLVVVAMGIFIRFVLVGLFGVFLIIVIYSTCDLPPSLPPPGWNQQREAIT